MEDKINSGVKFGITGRGNGGGRNDTPFTSQSVLFEARTGPKRQRASGASDTVHACLLSLPLGRHHLSRDRPVEQRSAGMGTRQHLRPTGPLQQLQRSVRDRLAAAQLGQPHTVRLQSGLSRRRHADPCPGNCLCPCGLCQSCSIPDNRMDYCCRLTPGSFPSVAEFPPSGEPLKKCSI
jgi:hypothetical protein